MNLSCLKKIVTLSKKVRRNLWPYCKKTFFLFTQYKKIFDGFVQRHSIVAHQLPEYHADIIVILFPRSLLSISGGLFSLLNIAGMTRHILGKDRKAMVVYLPGHYGFAKYPYFPNDEVIYTFGQLMHLYPNPENLIVHIPECYAEKVFRRASSREVLYLKSARRLHINILDQNIQLMPFSENIAHLRVLTMHLTQTVAHIKSNCQETADKWAMPVLHISAAFWKNYPSVPYEQKKNLIAYSPDQNPFTKDILSALRAQLPHFRFIKISGVSYTRYLEIICQSKYVISFGEGWDGYFFEPYFCGTIGCTVRNDIFFPKEIGYWETVYDDYEQMRERLPVDIKKYERDSSLYVSYCKKKYDEMIPNVDSSWSYFIGQLNKFYNNEYDYYPK